MAVKTELTGEDLEHFRENGYLVLPQAFNAEEVARMQHEADRILELIINSSLANGRKSGRLDILQTSTGPMVRKIQPINDLSLFLAEVSADERLIGPMRQLMGDEPILMEEKLNYKEPLPEAIEGIPLVDREDRFPVHNDWAYYLAQDYPQEIISSAVTMDPCDESSGPLHVWPGSHKQHLKHHRPPNKRGWEVLPDLIDFDGGIDLLAPPGSVMLFHSVLVHNSRPNVSGRPRRLMIYSHYPRQSDIGHDVRNGPSRLRESPYEWEYQRAKDRGEFEDVFRAPVFSRFLTR